MAGLDWHKAPIDLREQLSFTRNQVMELDRRLWKDPRIEGCALLSTCNRTELYLSCGDGADVDAGALLCAAAGVDYAPFADSFLSCRGRGEGLEQRNPPSRLRRATSLFKGGFERGGALMGMPAPAFGGVLRGVRRAGPGGDPRGTAKNFEARNPLGHSALRCFFNLCGKIF